MANKNDRLVLAYFVNEAAAKAAAKDIKEWDAFNDDVKLGAMAVLTVRPGSGKLHADEIGERETKRGAAWGTVIGAAVGLLTAGVGLIPGLIIGAAAGGGLGALNHKSVGMSDEEHAQLMRNLEDGGAALAIMCDQFEMGVVKRKLAEEGGRVATYVVPRETAEALTEAAAAQVSASAMIDAAASDVAEADVAAAARSIDAELPGLDQAQVDRVSRLAAVTGMSILTAEKLAGAGVAKASDLLAMAATPDGRKQLAASTGLDEQTILHEAKKLDLRRITGVGPAYASLLLACGVDTVPELAQRNPANLSQKMAELNAVTGICDELPSDEQVAGWIDQAKALPRMLFY